MNRFSHAVRAFPRTAACVCGSLLTGRISRAMLVRPNASSHPLIRCRAHCKSRRGHNAKVFVWRLDFWGFRASFRASEMALPRFVLCPSFEDSELTPFFVWSLLRV